MVEDLLRKVHTFCGKNVQLLKWKNLKATAIFLREDDDDFWEVLNPLHRQGEEQWHGGGLEERLVGVPE